MRTLLLSLLLASSALAQGMPGPVASAAWRPSRASGCVASWDASSAAKAAGHVLVGGVDLVPADDDYFARTSGDIPGVSGGAPTYPLTAILYFKPDATSLARLLTVSDGTTNEALYVSHTTVLSASAISGGSASSASTAASSVASGRWHIAIVVWSSAAARSAYVSTDTTGATSSATRSCSGLSQLHAGRQYDATNEFDGELGPMWLFNADLSGDAYSSVRTAIFNGADPERASGFTAIEHWPMEAATGASRSGSYDLTASGTPVATSRCLVVRDVKANTYHLRATTSAPDYDSTLFSGRGGVTFASASSEFLVCESAPVTAAPLQVYAVASSDSATADGCIFWIGDKDQPTEDWNLEFHGAGAGDPGRWIVRDGSSANPGTSTGYTASQAHLFWGASLTSTSHAVRIDGAGEGTDATDLTPDGTDRLALGQRSDSTPSTPLSGSIGHVGLLNVSSTEERANFHRFYRRYVSTLP